MKPRRAIDKDVFKTSNAVEADVEVEHKSLRALVFGFGDAMFLLLVSVASTTVMHLVHELGWNLAFTLLCGMAVAMGIQVLLATCVAPVLGSIESMVPSMVVAMISPMAVCTLDVAGFHIEWRSAVALGGAVGIGMFVSIEAYGFQCRRRFRRAYSGG